MRARQCLIYKLWLMGKLWQWRSTLYVFLLAYHKLYFKQHTNIVTLKPLRWHVCFISFWFELWAKLILDSFWHKHFFHHSIEKVLKNTKHVLTYKKTLWRVFDYLHLSFILINLKTIHEYLFYFSIDYYYFYIY